MDSNSPRDLQRRYDRQLTNGVCPHCNCSDETLVKLVEIDEGDVIIKECANCQTASGLDDTTDYSELRKSLEADGVVNTSMSPCPNCGNFDVEKFAVQELGDGNRIICDCVQCGERLDVVLVHNVIIDDDTDCSAASSHAEYGSWREASSDRDLNSLSVTSDYESYIEQEFDNDPTRLSSFCTCGLRWDEHEDVDYESIGYPRCETCVNSCPSLFSLVSLDDEDVLYCFECGAVFRPSNKSSGGSQESHISQVSLSPDDFSSARKVFQRAESEQTINERPSTCVYKRSQTELMPQIGKAGRTRVANIHMLIPGDHILWHRNYVAYHHAIVESVDSRRNQITIIEYTGSVHRKNGHFASVQSNTFTFNSSGDMMFRIDYDDNCSFSEEETLQRAKSRIGEAKYNLITNNCEHFATWCKTGCKESQQTKTFTNRMIRTAVTSGLKSFGELLTAGFIKTAKSVPFKDSLNMARDVGMKHTNNYGQGVTSFVKNVKGGALILGLTTNLAAEGISFAVHTDEAHKEYLAGKTSREDFERRRMKLGCESIGGFTGSVLGGIAGQFAIPIPIIGALVGSTLGSIIGRYIGTLIGKQISDKCWKTM